jgi:hypothetical protein
MYERSHGSGAGTGEVAPGTAGSAVAASAAAGGAGRGPSAPTAITPPSITTGRAIATRRRVRRTGDGELAGTGSTIIGSANDTRPA